MIVRKQLSRIDWEFGKNHWVLVVFMLVLLVIRAIALVIRAIIVEPATAVFRICTLQRRQK